MKTFLTYTTATITGILITGVFSVLMFFVMLAMLAISDQKTVTDENSVLRISLSGELTEIAPNQNSFSALLGENVSEKQGLRELKEAIRNAADHENIRGIYLEGGSLTGDYAALEELRGELLRFKQSKKFIIAYAEQYTQSCYYLASVADRVLINPSGSLDWRGLASQPIFYTELLEKLGVRMQVFKVGTYKSAVEPFTLTKMSEANREQVSSFVEDIWQGIVMAVSQSRKISPDSLNAYANRYMQLEDAKVLKQNKLVDNLTYADQVRQELQQRVGGELTLVSPEDLVSEEDDASDAKNIAVYYAEGDIVDAPNQGLLMGSSQEIVGAQVVEDLDKLANDDNIKAVVLRINSGGGSAYASEQMWRSVHLLSEKKPVVVSMGGMAASGGYYMACNARRIFADSSTLTGSIGIFGMIPDASDFLTQKLGLNFDVVKTNISADFGAMGRSFNDKEKAAFQEFVNRGYSLFLKRVSEGRSCAGAKMSQSDVDKVGQGRVWTGKQAREKGLVDELGGLDKAIAYAAKLTNIKSPVITTYPQPKPWWESFNKNDQQDEYLERKLKSMLGGNYNVLHMLVDIQRQNHLQARTFFYPNFL